MCSLLSLILFVTEVLNSRWWESLVTRFFPRGTQIVVFALRSHILKLWTPENKKRQWSFNYKNSPACHIRAQCFLSTAGREGVQLYFSTFFQSLLLLCLFQTMTLFSGSSQVTISCEGGCTDCSCSAGLCLVSLTLSKADHTIPSTPPAGQEHNPFTMHLPYRLSSYSNLYFPGSNSSHVTTFTVETVLCHCRCFLQWDEVSLDEWPCLFKGKKKIAIL